MVLTRSDKAKASRPEREPDREVTTSRNEGATQGTPALAGPSSLSTAPHSEVAYSPSATSVLTSGVPQDPPASGSASRPTTVQPPTAFAPNSPASPTPHNSGVRQCPVRPQAASTPSSDAATIIATDSATTGPFRAPLASNRPNSKRSSRQSERLLQIARAKEERARLQVEQARFQVKLADARVNTLEAEAHFEDDEDARTTITDDNEAEHSQRIGTWLNQQQVITQDNAERRDLTAPPTMHPPAAVQPLAAVMPPVAESLSLPAPTIAQPVETKEIAMPTARSDLAELVAAITASNQHNKPSPSHRYYNVELPLYNGSHQEWLSFKTAYNQSATSYSAVDNTARLRRALKGRAREAVENLLLHYTEPEEIMRTLEARFGRPEAIAMTEWDRLRALPKLVDCPRAICIFANKVSNIIAALKALDRLDYLCNPVLTMITSEKLPSTLRHQWFRFSASQPAGEPDLLKLARFLQQEADLCKPFAQPEPEVTKDENNRRGATNKPASTQRAYAAQEKGAKPCLTCRSPGHGPPDCPDFQKATTDDRWDMAKSAKLCFRCLRFRSRDHRCKTSKCGLDNCEYTHHELLHHYKTPPPQETVTSTWAADTATACLKMAPVTVIGPNGQADTWALLDDGSTVSLIDEEFAERVGAKGPIDPLFITAIGDNKIDATRSRRVPLALRGRAGEPQHMTLRTVKGLRLTPQKIGASELGSCAHFRDLQAHLDTRRATPKILIGQDNWHLLVTREMRTGRRDQLVASLTPLGWVIHGTHLGGRRHQVHFVAHVTTTDDKMDEDLRHYFAIESLTIAAKSPVNDPEQRALTILGETTRQLPDGRYETALLWRDKNIKMPSNRDAALTRLTSVERKLQKDPHLKQKYRAQMSALVTRGYAEVAPTPSTPDKTWYLPHFGVTNPAKPEKLRIVHDAAVKTKGKSLNSFLLTGPDLLQSLPGVLMRFRQHAVAVCADIAEMFMQVGVRPDDRDALRYLWRDDPTKPPTEYRMTSIIFGATSSPTTALYVKDTNARKYQNQYPEAVDAILKNMYMDDYLGSFRSPIDAARISGEVRAILQKAHFQLGKWATNSEEVLRQLTDEAPPTDVALSDGTETERVLGLVWRPAEDVLAFNLDMARIPQEVLLNSSPSKRQALRIVMSVYDPQGLASPVTIQARQILQDVWRRGTAWDAPLDDDLCDQWRQWMGQLQLLRDVSIPRCYPGYSDAVNLQLHTFVDASESAYAAALYWRAEMPDGEILVSLALAKARVAPLKLTSIPRLELQAAVMGSRMAVAVTEEHDRKPDSRVFWTDSATVLTWLRTGSRSYRPFVAHRIAAINAVGNEDNSRLDEWRWVPTKLNVADDATRHVPPDFDQQHRWFNGPDFLRKPEGLWPVARSSATAENTGEERCTVLAETTNDLAEALPNSERFSKWERYLRATARVLQFVDLTRRTRERAHYKRTRKNRTRDPTWEQNKKNPASKFMPATTPPEYKKGQRFVEINADTLRRAETLIWRQSQGEAFRDEIESIRQGKAIATSSRLRKVAVQHTDGLLRLKSRIANIVGADHVTTSPPILDGNRHEVKLLIDHIHRALHHAGTEATIGECRQSYWVIRLRPATKMVLNRCLPCRIRKDTPPSPSTGNHPLTRLAHHQRPFTYVGLDYFGPYLVAAGRSLQKHYVAIFTCLTTRAVHLEPTSSLSTDSAIMALRRMIARRGTPTEVWSDNGTNLRGADKELRRALDQAVNREASQRAIGWRFIPPGAPFMGGAWERMVRAVKTALAATQQPRHPTQEVFHTMLAEAEFTVNCRPLTHVSVSADDPAPLTPNHFLLGGPARLSAPGSFNDTDLIGRAHWRAAQRLADIFWGRWLREYLPDLQHRREPHCRGPAVKIGDVVIIADATLPRNTWPRGIVEAVYPGADAITRVVDVRTNGGIMRRPVKRIVILPTTPAVHRDECSLPDTAARRENVHDALSLKCK